MCFLFMGGLNILDRCHSYGNFNINRCGVLIESSGEVVVKVRISFVRLRFVAEIRTIGYIESLLCGFQFLVFLNGCVL